MCIRDRAHTQQHQVASSNAAHALAIDRHAGVEYALHHRAHGLLLARQFGGQMLERMESMADGVLLIRRALGLSLIHIFILRGGRLVMASKVLPTRSSGS